jgi:glycosyltransferase involved in cell wall biosynthesis
VIALLPRRQKDGANRPFPDGFGGTAVALGPATVMDHLTVNKPAPTVTIVIPCYKQAHLLPEAVESVLAQTFTDWECVIIDDGSPDETAEVADEYAQQHPDRIRVIHKVNAGLANARNSAIRTARGRYILPLDADDRLAPDMLAKTVAVLERDPRVSIVYTDMQHFGVKNDHWRCGQVTLAGQMQINFLAYSSLYRRGIWDAVGGYNGNIDAYADWDFWIGAFERGYRAAYIAEPLFHYRVAASSMLTEANKRYNELFARVILNHPDLYPNDKIESARRALALSPPKPRKRGKVAIFCDYFYPHIGGQENIVLDLGLQLQAAGFEVDVATSRLRDRTSLVHRGLRIIELDVASSPLTGGLRGDLAPAQALMESGQYDAAFAIADPCTWPVWIVGGRRAERTRAILIPGINDEGFAAWGHIAEARAAIKDLLLGADKVILSTSGGVDARFLNEERVPFTYVPNAIAALPPKPGFRARFGLDDRPIVLHVANFLTVKNQVGLLQELAGAPGDFQLVMVGRPYDSGYFTQVQAHAAKDDRVHVIPGLSREDVAAAMHEASLFVLPSIAEIAPLVLVEAMTCGLPWLATPAVGSGPELAGGHIIPLAEFPAEIMVLLADDEQRAQLGAAGREAAQARFSWPAVLDRYLPLCAPKDAMPKVVPLGAKDIHRPGPEPLPPAHPAAPTVSVIVPTHNRPELLVRAVRSILAQTFQDFEIIVVNDGGVPVDEPLRDLDASGRIHIVSSGRVRGLPGARNLGLRIARSKYIAYLDDDDLFYPDHLETLVAALASGETKVAYTDAERLHVKQVGSDLVTVKKDVPYSIDFDRNLLLERNITPVLCVMHERACLGDVGLFDESMGVLEDWELWLRMSARFPFRHVAKVTCGFSWRSDGTGMTNERQELFDVLFTKVRNRYGEPVARQPFVPASELSLQFLEFTANSVLQQAGGAEGAVRLASTLEQKARDGHDGSRHDLALLYLALGRPSDAEQTLRAAATTRPSPAIHLALVAFCLAADRVQEAVRHIESVLAIEPENRQAMVMAGDASLSLGRAGEAADFYRAARVDPDLRPVADARLANLRAQPLGSVISAAAR